MVEAGAQVLICYSHGEGASILLRVKALGLSFKGIYMTQSPGLQAWATYLGTDGDYVVTPGQWAAEIIAPCFVFGTAQTTARSSRTPSVDHPTLSRLRKRQLG
jgi:hypothetical protein